jgi:hypothetical protein
MQRSASLKVTHWVNYTKNVEEEDEEHFIADQAKMPMQGTQVDYSYAHLASDKEYLLVDWILMSNGIGCHALNSEECHIHQSGQT